jgi:hypothetical protein
MNACGVIRKLKSVFKDSNTPIEYYLPIGDQEIALNQYIGQSLHLKFSDHIQCLYCEKKTKKSYQQGYCFPCAQTLARCDLCIVRPEKCHYRLGTCREPEWGLKNCFIPHIVYLANTSGLKVGITRETQIPTRWIDQGASQALPLFWVNDRYQSGLIETKLKQWMNDRTDWRKMLVGAGEQRELKIDRDEVLQKFSADLPLGLDLNLTDVHVLEEAESVQIQYPVLNYPSKVKSINIEKQPEIKSVLTGIKGQYLLLEEGVINVRNLGGYFLSLSF